MNPNVKKRITVTVLSVLIVVIVALVVTLVLIISNNNREISQCLLDNEQLQSENDQLYADIANISKKLEDTKSALNSVNSALQEQQKLTAQYENTANMWRNKFLNADVPGEADTDSFESVDALINAVKKSPSTYQGKRIKLLGNILKIEDENVIAISDYWEDSSSDYMVGFLYRNRPNIKVKIPDEFQRAVIGSGDYVKLYGTVKVSNGEFYLDDCEYSVVLTHDER